MLQAGSIFPSQVIVRVISKKSDARTHRTPKALRAKYGGELLLFRASFWSAHASPRRFHFRDASTIFAAIACRAATTASVRPEWEDEQACSLVS